MVVGFDKSKFMCILIMKAEEVIPNISTSFLGDNIFGGSHLKVSIRQGCLHFEFMHSGFLKQN